MSKQQTQSVLISLVIGGLCLFVVFYGVEQDELLSALKQFNFWYLIPAVAVSLVMQLFRAWRWQLELRPLEHVRFGTLWVIICVGYMAINVLPARLGEFVRPWLLSRRTNVAFSNVVGNLVIEKTLDSMCIVFFILIGLLTTSDLPDWVQKGAAVPAAIAATLATLVGLLYFKGEAFVDRHVLERLPERFRDKVRGVLESIIDGMNIIPDGRLLASVMALSLAYWSLPVLSSYIAILGFGFELPFNAAIIVFICIGFGTAIPNAPLQVGTYQAACIVALSLFGVPRADALAYGILLNAIQAVTLVAQGLVALPFADVTLADFQRARAEVASE